jgi:hypothetical protein
MVYVYACSKGFRQGLVSKEGENITLTFLTNPSIRIRMKHFPAIVFASPPSQAFSRWPRGIASRSRARITCHPLPL